MLRNEEWVSFTPVSGAFDGKMSDERTSKSDCISMERQTEISDGTGRAVWCGIEGFACLFASSVLYSYAVVWYDHSYSYTCSSMVFSSSPLAFFLSYFVHWSGGVGGTLF